MQFSRISFHVLPLRLKALITPFKSVLQRLTVTTYLTFTSISFPDGRQVPKLRESVCISYTVEKSRLFRAPCNDEFFRTYIHALRLHHVLAMWNGDAMNQSSSWRPAQPPLGARAPKHLTSPAPHILTQLSLPSPNPRLPPPGPLFFQP